ncbi:hypothetical protein [Bacteroides acidifaciens]|nr:hypothetical protein [Bacteroides acidifaciens]
MDNDLYYKTMPEILELLGPVPDAEIAKQLNVLFQLDTNRDMDGETSMES